MITFDTVFGLICLEASCSIHPASSPTTIASTPILLSADRKQNIDKTRPELDPNIFEQVEIEIKYEGYIQKQLKQVEQMKKLEVKQLPKDFDYNEIEGLRLEAREKLNKIKPLNIGQASRISGVSPADISVLLIWLAQNNRRQ